MANTDDRARGQAGGSNVIEFEGLTVPAPFRDLIGYYLRIAQEASFQAISEGAGKSGLKPGWYTLLTVLATNADMTPSDLSRICGRDRSTLTATLTSLAARGLIQRRHRPEDRRSYVVSLTPAGIATQARLREIATEHDRRLDEIVGEDKPVLIAALRRIAGRLGLPQPGALADAGEAAPAEPAPRPRRLRKAP